MSLINKMNGWRALWLVSNSIFVSWFIVLLKGKAWTFDTIAIVIFMAVAVAASTYLLGSVIALSRLNKANGWQRLWVVSICIFFLWALFGEITNVHYEVAGMYAIALVPFISLGTYALGIAISWVMEGFKG